MNVKDRVLLPRLVVLSVFDRRGFVLVCRHGSSMVVSMGVERHGMDGVEMVVTR